MKWYFTFMQKQPTLHNKFVCIQGTFSEARQQINAALGDQWAFQYSEEDFKGQAAQFNLTEIALSAC